jgi:hypothetical protein
MLCAGHAQAGTVTRPGKTGVACGPGPAWVDGCKPNAVDMNAEADLIVNLVNGNIDNANISSSAAITQGKIVDPEPSEVDGYSDTTTEMDDDESPGDYTTRTQATTLQKEIEQLRYKLAQSCGLQDAVRVNGSGAQDVGWLETCAGMHNLVNNDQFINDFDNDNTPDGWTLVGGGTANNNDAATAQGFGKVLAVGGSTTNDGASYTLDELRASTRYLVTWKGDCVLGTCDLSSTGALATGEWRNVDVDFGASAGQQSAVFMTTATPADVTLTFACDSAAACVISVQDFGVYALTPYRSAPQRFYQLKLDEDATHSCTVAGAPITTDLAITVAVPGPAYLVRARVEGTVSSTGGLAPMVWDLQEDGATMDSTLSHTYDADIANMVLPFSFERVSQPAAGSHTYRVQCSATSSNATLTNGRLTVEVIPE